MKLKITLKVPADPPEGYPEFVSHGNLEAELVPGGTVETSNAGFARFLVDDHQLVIVSEEEVDAPVAAAEEAPPADDKLDPETYPEDFPGRDALIEANVPFETVKTLTAEQLDAYKGIGPKTAADIVAYFEGGAE